MLPTAVILVAIVLMLGFLLARRAAPARSQPVRAVPLQAARPAPRAPARAPLREVPRRREVPPLEMVPTPAAPGPAEHAQKIRDRYIAVRFAGAFRDSAALAQTDNVIRMARLYFDEAKVDRAMELLQLAIEQSPAQKALRLAQLEIAFLARDAQAYGAFARAFQAAFPASAEWAEISRLGHALAPDDAAFAAAPKRAHEHYGPWPDTPNWIQASWDLTSEVLAAELHRGLCQGTPAP